MAVYRCSSLDAFAKFDYMFRMVKDNCLDNIMAAFCGIGNTFKTKLFINIGSKNRPLQRSVDNLRRQKQPLEKGTINAKACADFLSKAGRRKTERGIFHVFFFTGNVTANGGQSAAGIFYKGAYAQICAHI